MAHRPPNAETRPRREGRRVQAGCPSGCRDPDAAEVYWTGASMTPADSITEITSAEGPCLVT